jgi:iron complex outermembrane receptor protein
MSNMIQSVKPLNKSILLFALSFVLLFAPALMAQQPNVTVEGRVTDANGLPLSGASIILKGLRTGTTSDEKGNFLLQLPKGRQVVQVSSIGYVSTDAVLNLGNEKVSVDLRLIATNNLMEEVNITAVKKQSAAATRTAVQIQYIPQAITVIGQRIMQQQAAFDLATIVKNMAGVNFTGNYSGAGSSQFFNARGFDLNDSQNYRLNGVMVWNWGNHYADNIEQVEFLKGPNSILFGDVAPGGVMNFVTKKPLGEFMANVELKTGSWGLVRPALDVTGPITKDRSLRYRINTSYERSDSFRDYVSSARQFIAPVVAWDITPKLSLQVEAVFKSSSATDDAGLVSPDGTIAGLRTLSPSLYLGEPSREFQYKDQSYFSTLSYEINRTWRIKSTAFYGHSSNRPFGLWFDQPDADGNFDRRAYGFYQKAKNGTLALDVYGSFYTKSIKHQVLFGYEYQSTSYRQTNGGELALLDQNNIFSPVYGQSVLSEPVERPYQPYATGVTRSGLHVQDQLVLFKEHLQLLLGLRFGKTKQGNRYIENELSRTAFEGYTDDLVSKNVVTPRIGLVYKLTDAYTLYASYAKGYEINSPDLFAQNYLTYASPPATLSTQLEAGLKTSLLQQKLGVTLSVFELNKRNPYGYVYLDPVNPNYDEYNVYYEGHHRSRGAELEVDGTVAKGLSITGGFAYTDAKVISDPGYPSGNSLPNAPKYGGNFWANFEPVHVLSGLHIGTGIFYKSKFFSSIQNDLNLLIPSSYTWDAMIGYKYKSAGIQLNVMNITNQVSYLNPWLFNLFDVRPLRQFVVTLNYRFTKK